jgi:VWFA-related protein
MAGLIPGCMNRGFLMPDYRRSRKLASFLFVFVLVGAMNVQLNAQKPSPKSQSKSPTRQKNQPLRQEAKAEVKAEVKAEEKADDQPLEVSDEIVKIDTGLVQLDVTVIDQTNTPVFNLNKDNFTIYENKVKQVIESVRREEVPLSFGLVIDTSGSMQAKLPIVTEASLGLLKQLRADDEGFIAEFKYDTELVQAFTRDKRKLEKSLGGFYPTGGTALLNAIIGSAEYAAQKGSYRRKALIIISDGLERNSSISEKEVMEAIRETEVQIYLVGFFDEDVSSGLPGKPENKKAKELLKRLADESGGRAFFPNDIDEMKTIAAQIAKDLRTQYVVNYYPSDVKRDGTFRSIKVEINSKDSRKLIARTRMGYYSRNEHEPAP